MAYGLKYQAEFTSITEVDYRVEILEDGYSGPFYTLPLAEKPVVHKWNADEPKEPLKGSNLTLSYLNKGAFPIDIFYSPNDEQFKVIFYEGANILFVGYVVQDDCIEVLVDYTHRVTIAATDNIGLLKDVFLDTSNEVKLIPVLAQGDYISVTVPPQNWIYITNYTPVLGVPFTITNHPVAIMNDTFTPTLVVKISDNRYNVRIAVVTGDTINAPCTIDGSSVAINNTNRLSLANYIHACIARTGLALPIHVYSRLYEDTNLTNTSLFHQTYLSQDTFVSGDGFMSCSDVLEKILKPMGFTLFQALGVWNIIRWDDLTQGLVPGFTYDSDFNYTGTTTLPAAFIAGFQQDTYPETGITKQIIRPYKFVKETFNYVQPKYLLQNNDLHELGVLVRDYFIGLKRVKEYEIPKWGKRPGTTNYEALIRIVYDDRNAEIERYIMMKGDPLPPSPSNGYLALHATPFEVTQGDDLVFTFSTRGINFFLVTGFITYIVELTNGVNTYYAQNNTTWAPAPNYFQFPIPVTPNMQQWTDVSISGRNIPINGVITVYLNHYATSPIMETHYKDMRIELTQFINSSNKVIGHVHKDAQDVTIKNVKDFEIFIDDAPRSYFNGTLFTAFFPDLLQTRTISWHREGRTESKRLGNIATEEELQWRSVPRGKLEGTLRGLQQSQNLSLLNYLTYAELPGLNFVPGILSLDYRNNLADVTYWELFSDTDVDVVDDYTFTYLYEK